MKVWAYNVAGIGDKRLFMLLGDYYPICQRSSSADSRQFCAWDIFTRYTVYNRAIIRDWYHVFYLLHCMHRALWIHDACNMAFYFSVSAMYTASTMLHASDNLLRQKIYVFYYISHRIVAIPVTMFRFKLNCNIVLLLTMNNALNTFRLIELAI